MENSLPILREMEQTEKYVFHGSGSKIEVFEPRQAHNHINGVDIPDGDPAIFASSKLNYAIFMAIINKKNCAKGYRSSSNGREFKATKETLKQLTPDANGYVHVFDRFDFKERTNDEEECVRHEPITPLHVYKVTMLDIDFPILDL